MFENVIGQKRVVETLKHNIATGSLPSSILFTGENYSAKLTTALELARAVSCEENAEWNCGCKSCNQHRLLSSNTTLLLGPRYFIDDLHAAQDVLKRHDKPFVRFIFIRAVMKLLRRFDEMLWEGDETRLKKVNPTITKIKEQLDIFLPEHNIPIGKDHYKAAADIIDLAKKIPNGHLNVSINQIRRMTYWAHLTSDDKKKVVIIENAEKLNDSARNSLLKILEEPPSHVIFILTTTRKAAIIPTVLSRVRQYHFTPRHQVTAKTVISRIFRENNDEFNSIKDYFQACKDVQPGIIRTAAHEFIEALFNDDITFGMLQEQRLQGIGLRSLLEELTNQMSRILKREYSSTVMDVSKISEYVLVRWSDIINDTLSCHEVLNQNEGMLIESMFYKMKEAV